MRRILIILSLLLIMCFGLNLLIPSKSLPVFNMKLLSKYEKTEGGNFLNSLNEQTLNNDDVASLTDVPYDVNLYFKETKLDFKNKVLHRFNRYYVPITEFSKYFAKDVLITDAQIQISDQISLKINNKTYIKDDKTIPLRGELAKVKNEYYISFFDMCEMLDLTTYWDYKSNNIIINNKKPNKKGANGPDKNTKRKNKHKKDAYIRFEDVSAGDVYAKQDSLEKLRVITDYMADECQNFSLGWVPRYINTSLNIDNDISKDNSFPNANFLFTLDYLVNRGDSIGIHGYTHQYEDTNSIAGIEFGDDGYSTESATRNRVESAINLATKLNIPYAFWETPHYHATVKQQAIFEEYFKVIYEPSLSKYNKKIITSERNGITKFVPAPLSNIKNDDVIPMLKSFQSKPSNVEMSLFYHPSIEIDSVHVSLISDGTINTTYDDNSILKQMISCISDLGYSFKSINDL